MRAMKGELMAHDCMTPDPYLVLVSDHWRCSHCGRWWERRVGLTRLSPYSTRMSPGVEWYPMGLFARVRLRIRFIGERFTR